jgi:hypothetical protein
MSEKPKPISINIVDTDPEEVLLAQYLRSTGKIKPTILDAAAAFWYPIAVSGSSETSIADKELAVIRAVTTLSSQISYIIEHSRIKDGISYSQETLQRCGVMLVTTAIQSPTFQPEQVMVPVQVETTITPKSTDSDNDWGNED